MFIYYSRIYRDTTNISVYKTSENITFALLRKLASVWMQWLIEIMPDRSEVERAGYLYHSIHHL